MIATPFQAADGSPVMGCGISVHALVEARLSAIAGLRDGGFPDDAPALPARFLRHCDEHTVVGVHAALKAIAASAADPADLGRDAVVAATCQAGRIMAARSLAQLRIGGAVTVSTHIVPQASLHAPAGALSVALGMHGPHLGVSGGPDALAEGLLAAITLATTAAAPRVWLLVTEWDEEPTLDDAGAAAADPLCRALAIAIESGSSAPLALGIRFPTPPAPAAATPSSQLAAFADAVAMCGPGGALVSWTLATPWGGEVRLMRRQVTARAAWQAPGRRLREAA